MDGILIGHFHFIITDIMILSVIYNIAMTYIIIIIFINLIIDTAHTINTTYIIITYITYYITLLLILFFI